MPSRGLSCRVRITTSCLFLVSSRVSAVPRNPDPPAMTIFIGTRIAPGRGGLAHSGGQGGVPRPPLTVKRGPVLTNQSVKVRNAAGDARSAHTAPDPTAHPCRRLRRVRRPRLCRHHRRPHRRSRPRQQGDDLLPLSATSAPCTPASFTMSSRRSARACAPRSPKTLRRNESSTTVIDTLVRSVDESTYFLPIFLREIADGGAHLGPEELALIAGMFATVSGIIIDGEKQNVFQRVHPALAHFTLIGPLIMFRATAPVRARDQGRAPSSKFPMPTPTRWCAICKWSRIACWRCSSTEGRRHG